VEEQTKLEVVDVTHRAGKGLVEGIITGLKRTFDESAFFAGGAAAAAFASWLRNRGLAQRAETVQQARDLYTQGKHQEAIELVIKAEPFGIGYGDEAVMLSVVALVLKIFIDFGQEDKIEPYLDALDALDIDARKRLAMTLSKFQTDQQRAEMMFHLADGQGDVGANVTRALKISRIILDPEDHTANQFFTALGGAVYRGFGDHDEKVRAARQRIQEKKEERKRKAL
jgi:hypothetical protein